VLEAAAKAQEIVLEAIDDEEEVNYIKKEVQRCKRALKDLLNEGGLRASGFLLVRRQMLPTLAGHLFTLVVVLVQFRDSSQNSVDTRDFSGETVLTSWKGLEFGDKEEKI